MKNLEGILNLIQESN